MKAIIVSALALTLCAGAFAKGSHSVKGHVTKKGTYVAPHRQSDPDGSKTNNWSHKGNVNPYTGKEGTKQ